MTTIPSCITEGDTLISFEIMRRHKGYPTENSQSLSICRTSFTLQYGKETITPIPDSSVKIGQRQEMSNIDIQRINNLYECGK